MVSNTLAATLVLTAILNAYVSARSPEHWTLPMLLTAARECFTKPPHTVFQTLLDHGDDAAELQQGVHNYCTKFPLSYECCVNLSYKGGLHLSEPEGRALVTEMDYYLQGMYVVCENDGVELAKLLKAYADNEATREAFDSCYAEFVNKFGETNFETCELPCLKKIEYGAMQKFRECVIHDKERNSLVEIFDTVTADLLHRMVCRGSDEQRVLCSELAETT